MRAGSYAVVDGVDYPCQQLHGTSFRLLAAKTAPPPPDFEDSGGFRWTRVVDAGQVTRQYFVLTTAVWRGSSVQVDRVLGDRATIELHDPTGTHDFRPTLLPWGNGGWSGSVPVDSLTQVEEIRFDALPDLPTHGHRAVRAGGYATLDGVDYPCGQLGVPRLHLFVPKSDPQPPGFRDERGLRWGRSVASGEVTRQYSVRTTAVWRGREVIVRRVLGNEALIELYGSVSLPYHPELSWEREGRWSGSVPVDSLADVEEKVIEVRP